MKSIKIDIPKGYVIDEENSTFEEIKFKLIQDFEYIDLGLPSGTLWATCNVGANSLEEYGKYFTFKESQNYNYPTKEQFNELRSECRWLWCNIKDINGYLVIGKTGNYIFLPATGYRDCNGSVFNVGSYGSYWSSTPNNSKSAWGLYFYSGEVYMNHNYCFAGQSVREVKNKQDE